jgi:hypothetical protein
MSQSRAAYYEQRACTSKSAYPTAEGAWAGAGRVMTRTGERMKVYRCRLCTEFHIAHADRSRRKEHR